MIITLTQVKSLLNISGTAQDTLISALIPEAEAKYLQIRNYPFMQIQGSLTDDDKTVSDIYLYPYTDLSYAVDCNRSAVSFLNRMDYLYNSTNSIDNYITDIDLINNTVEIDTAASTTALEVVFTVYPSGSKMIAAKLIQYMMQGNSMSGLQSESIGSYSWSAKSAGNPFGVPDDIFKSIKRYVSA
jgi:hypothetical protein